MKHIPGVDMSSGSLGQGISAAVGMALSAKLTNDDYDVENIDLTFRQYSEKIEYIASFDITYRIRMFGESFPPIRRHVELTGSHNTKY